MTAEQPFRGHAGEIVCVAISDDGQWIVSGSEDKTIRRWSVKTGGQLCIFRGHTSRVSSVVIVSDQKRIVSGSFDNTLRVWCVESGDQILAAYGWHSSRIFLQSEKWIFSWFRPNRHARVTFQKWNIDSGKHMPVWEQQPRNFSACLGFSSDTKLILGCSSSFPTVLRLWSVESGKKVCALYEHAGFMRTATISSDDKWIAACENKTIRLWNVETGEKVHELHGHKRQVTCLAFSHDVKFFVSGSDDWTLCLWSVETGKQLRSFRNKYKGSVHCVAISKDARRIVCGSAAKAVRVWTDFFDLMKPAVLPLLQWGLPPYVVLNVLDHLLTIRYKTSFATEEAFMHANKINYIRGVQRTLNTFKNCKSPTELLSKRRQNG